MAVLAESTAGAAFDVTLRTGAEAIGLVGRSVSLSRSPCFLLTWRLARDGSPYPSHSFAHVTLRQTAQIEKSVYSGFTASVGGKSMPAATVALVPCSMRMNEPVRRLVA